MHTFVAVSGIVAGILSLLGYIPSLYTSIKGKTRLNRATWAIWTLVSFLLLASYHGVGASDTIWLPLGDVVGITITFFVSLHYGEGGWEPLDKACLSVVALSVVLWIIFKDPLVVLLINLCIDVTGAVPTIRKSFVEPEKENRLTWALFLLANVINLFAIDNWHSFRIVIYPVTMVAICVAIGIPVFLWPRRKLVPVMVDARD